MGEVCAGNTQSFYPEDDYYTLKRYLEDKEKIKAIFSNPERKEKLKEFISSKDAVKNEMKKISEDENYAKGLGLTA